MPVCIWSFNNFIGATETVAEVVLQEKETARGLLAGKNGEIVLGYAFSDAETEEHITVDITEQYQLFPVLIAASKKQFDNWKKEKIIAKQMHCIWKPLKL